MKLEHQVCNRIQSGELKALGVAQDSAFIWSSEAPAPMFAMIVKPSSFWTAAYNSSELGEMLPGFIQSFQDERGWNWMMMDPQIDEEEDCAEDVARGFKIVAMGEGEFEYEAEARADCLLYLLNQRVISVKDLNTHMGTIQ